MSGRPLGRRAWRQKKREQEVLWTERTALRMHRDQAVKSLQSTVTIDSAIIEKTESFLAIAEQGVAKQRLAIRGVIPIDDAQAVLLPALWDLVLSYVVQNEMAEMTAELRGECSLMAEEASDLSIKRICGLLSHAGIISSRTRRLGTDFSGGYIEGGSCALKVFPSVIQAQVVLDHWAGLMRAKPNPMQPPKPVVRHVEPVHLSIVVRAECDAMQCKDGECTALSMSAKCYGAERNLTPNGKFHMGRVVEVMTLLGLAHEEPPAAFVATVVQLMTMHLHQDTMLSCLRVYCSKLSRLIPG